MTTTPNAVVGTRYLGAGGKRLVTGIRRKDMAVEWSINEFSNWNYALPDDWNAWVETAEVIEEGVFSLSGMWPDQRANHTLDAAA